MKKEQVEGRTMPHVVLNGRTNIEAIFRELKPLFVRDGNTILKTSDIYLERGKNAIMIESLVIEPEKKTSFLAMITGRPDGVVIRLYPKVEVEKTDNVKRTLAEIAKQLLQSFPDFKSGETNLSDYLVK
jgi:hypothetical protein